MCRRAALAARLDVLAHPRVRVGFFLMRSAGAHHMREFKHGNSEMVAGH